MESGHIFGWIPGFWKDTESDNSDSVSGCFWTDTVADSSDSVSGRFGQIPSLAGREKPAF